MKYLGHVKEKVKKKSSVTPLATSKRRIGSHEHVSLRLAQFLGEAKQVALLLAKLQTVPWRRENKPPHNNVHETSQTNEEPQLTPAPRSSPPRQRGTRRLLQLGAELSGIL